MDLGLTETQQMLRTSARTFLEAECPTTHVREMELDDRGFSPDIWQKMAAQGWLGLTIPEAYGGAELEFIDLVILLEEMGRYMLPSPFFSTTVLSSLAIMESGDHQQKEEYLTRIAAGQIIVAMAITEPSATWDCSGIQLTAELDGSKYNLSGTKLFVSDGNVADYILVAARTGSETTDISLFILPTQSEGINQTQLKTIASDNQSAFTFENVKVSKVNLLGKENNSWPIIQKIIQWGAIGKCAEMTGGGQKVLDMTVEYAKQRTQFGRPIGSFQAIQHHCANMATDVETAKFITYKAAWTLTQDLNADKEVAMAKAWVSDSYGRVCALAHQSHGAIGFTKEHDLQLYSRRAKAAELAFGDSDFHLENVAPLIGLSPNNPRDSR